MSKQNPVESLKEGSGLIAHPALPALVVGLAACSPFAPALDGELLWDDPLIIGRLAQLSSWWKVFSSDLFGVSTGDAASSGAVYWRPLVSLSFFLELKVAPASPEFLMHATNIAWHVLASILVYRALRRWTGAVAVPAVWACALSACIWAALPVKAESVAWISGRADPMGTAVLLISLELTARFASLAPRVLVACLGTAVALLTKEAMLIAPLFFLVEAGARTCSWRQAWRSPEPYAAGAVAAAYLLFRMTTLRIAGPNAEAFEGLTATDRLLLPLETIGYAVASLALPWRAYILKGPYAFAAGGVVHEPIMAAVGATALCGAGLCAWRIAWTRRPIILLSIALLPVSNLIPNALESRMSDRFLYLPSVGAALGIALALTRVPAGKGRALAGALIAFAAVACGLLTFERSGLFRRATELWSWELQHGSQAASVYVNAAWAAEKDGELTAARDLCLRAVQRQRELGYGSGAAMTLQAARLHATWAGQSDRGFLDAHTRALDALVSGRPEIVEFVFPAQGTRTLDTGSTEGRQLAEQQRTSMRRQLLLRSARLGDPGAVGELDQIARTCAGCLAPVADAALGHLAHADPDGALNLLEGLPAGLPIKEELAATAKVQQRALAGIECSSAERRAHALFLGEAYGASCRAMAGKPVSEGSCGDPVRLACALSGEPLPGPLAPIAAHPLQQWNVDRQARERIVALTWQTRQ